MPSVSIRLATVEDAQAYGSLLDSIISEGLQTIVPRGSAPTVERIRSFVAAHDGTQSALFLAFEGEALVGSLNLTRHTRPETQHVVSLGVNVASQARGAGIGNSLMAEALNWAKARDFADRIELEVLENNGPAIRLYERFGFVKEGHRNCAVKRESRYLTSLMYASVERGPRSYAG